jgi:hypothetical protein
MNRSTKTAAIITSSLLLAVCLSVSTVGAQQMVVDHDPDSYLVDSQPLEQAQLDQVLAPIALYPDSLLSQILVAATYPLEVVQATRWRQANQSLSEKQVLAAIEDKRWDPSVKALTPFTDLITRLSKDLDWLQQLGDALLQNEEQVLASIQTLRQKARDNGSIADNDYYDVVEDNDNIIIKSTNREIVYVPYYDSRVVYGAWGWNDYQPVYWHRPPHYRLHAGFYWSDRFYIRPTIFFGGFHWRSRNLVVNQHYYDQPYRYNNRYRNIGVSDYRHWNHNPVHRRGVRYTRNGGQNWAHRNQSNSRLRATNERPNDGNRVFSSNPRNEDNIRLRERNRAQQNEAQQRLNSRLQQSSTSTAKPVVVENNESNRRRTITNRSAPQQQYTSRPERREANTNRNSNSTNPRNAPVANNPPKRTVVARDDNASGNNDKAASRATVRNTPDNSRRYKGSNTRPHKQPD